MPYHATADTPMTKPAEHAAIVSSKGQVVIPGDVRRKLGLTQGSVLRFVVDADSVRLLAADGGSSFPSRNFGSNPSPSNRCNSRV